MVRVFLILGKLKGYSRHFTFGKWQRNSKKWEVFQVLSLGMLIPSDENYFPSLGILFSSLAILFSSLAILFSSLAISFSSDGIFIFSDIFSIISRDFFTKVRNFPLKEGKFRKNKPIFCENIKKLRNSEALRIDYFRPTLLELKMAC